jgi:hypothetical protein
MIMMAVTTMNLTPNESFTPKWPRMATARITGK